MSDNKQNHQPQEGQDYIKGPSDKKPGKLFHHSLIFWIFLLLMLFGITYYILTLGFLNPLPA